MNVETSVIIALTMIGTCGILARMVLNLFDTIGNTTVTNNYQSDSGRGLFSMFWLTLFTSATMLGQVILMYSLRKFPTDTDANKKKLKQYSTIGLVLNSLTLGGAMYKIFMSRKEVQSYGAFNSVVKNVRNSPFGQRMGGSTVTPEKGSDEVKAAFGFVPTYNKANATQFMRVLVVLNSIITNVICGMALKTAMT